MYKTQYFNVETRIARSSILRKSKRISDENGARKNQIDHVRYIEDVVCDNEQAAMEYLAQIENNAHETIAIQFKEIPDRPQPARTNVNAAEERVRDLKSKLDRVEAMNYANTLTATKYIGCKNPNCRSRLRTAYIKVNYCPLCGADLRPKSTAEHVAKLKTKIAKAEADLAKELEIYEAKRAAKAITKWLVKVDYEV